MELLAVIGIIAILIAVLVPTVISVRRSAEKNAARMDLQAIGVALEAYRADFKDYPRPPDGQRKYRVLAWALMGPYDATGTVADPLNTTQMLGDGADGLGFRTQYDPGVRTGGKVWGPYLANDKFKLLTSAANPDFATTPADLRWDIVDRYGAPIEYFPRWRAYRAGAPLFGTDQNTAATATYDYRQQWQPNPKDAPNAKSPVMNYVRRALGDDYQGKNLSGNVPGTQPNDVIDGTEVAREMPPFILVSRGPSKTFPGQNDPVAGDQELSFRFEKCDVTTNLQH